MKRLLFGVALSLSCSFAALAQAPAPGAPTVRPSTPGAQLPGMPTRDANRPGAPQSGTGKISGRVLAATTGQPLRRAQVTLTGGGTAASVVRKSTTTDADGRYEFSELPAGSFLLTATKTGFVNLQYGQRRPFEQGTPVAVADAQVMDKVDFMLPRGGVIVARITDDFGDPLAGAQVQIQRYQYQPDGQRRLVSAPVGGLMGLAGTDDHGVLRVYGLMPGEYIVSASMRSLAVPGLTGDTGEGFSPTFYPGVVAAEQASPVPVRVGEEANVQISMTTTRLAKVGGTVVDSEGRPAAGAQLTLITRSGTGFFSSGAGVVSPDGSFTITGVAPGEHTLEVRPRMVAPGTGATSEGASTTVNVGGADVLTLRIVTSRGAHISGRVIYDGTSPRDGLPIQPRVMVSPVDPSRQLIPMLTLTDPLANGTIDDKGNFQIAGASGRVFFNVTTPPGWVMKSVMLDGQNIIDEPMDLAGRSSISDLVITVTDKVTTINGQVTDARSQVMRDYVVVILPAQEMEPTLAARWTRTVRPNTDGRFEIRGLRPGRYLAVAVDAIEQGRQFAPEFQQQMRQAAREFTLGEGQTATLDLRLTPDL